MSMAKPLPTSIAGPADTPLDSIPEIMTRLRTAFRNGRTRPIEWRKEQLRKLWWGIRDCEADIIAALQQDMRKPMHETLQTEIIWAKNDIIDTLAGIDEWVKDERVAVDFLMDIAKPVRRKEPLGVVMIIGAYNYPFQLTFGPLLGAIAAGNAVVIKPSEICAASASVIKKIIENYLDPEAFAVVTGAIPETTKLLEQKFDKILYTGNGMVGRIVATAAAKHLTPVVLELGGLNPAIITKNADIKLATKRICWGKCLNGGQVCLSPDYAIVPSTLEAEFIANVEKTFKKFYPDGMQGSKDFTHIVNKRHFHRIKKMIDDSTGEIKVGGKHDEAENFIEVTVVKVKDETDALLRDEIFGPVLPYVVIDDLDEVIEFVNRVSDSPLALYAFTKDTKEADKILNSTRSGGATINDTIWHAASSKLPFGGVGESGTGCYRGKFGFDQFSHLRTTSKQAGGWIEKILDTRYPPYTSSKTAQYRAVLEKRANFTRDGKVTSSIASWMGWVLSFGGGDPKTVMAKYVLTILGVVYLKNHLENKRRLT